MTAGVLEPFSYGADEIVISQREYLRYMGAGAESDGALTALVDDCLCEVKDALRIRGVMRTSDVSVAAPAVRFSFCEIESGSLSKNLSGCSSSVLFAITAGAEIDRLISKYSAVSPSRALVIDAVASAAVEGAANKLNAEVKKRYGKTKPRFSPGFGDLDLGFQRDLLSFVDAGRRAGVLLTASMMLTPMKSTTAIIGICEEQK
ncbi:MAG: hypothetical protein IKN50_00655 [Clostridia bacterium]|nr:hypothetical protein [Clostridia bacterium]MBR3639095.1 hypothetical protein [Clostridia bacterium]